MPGVAVRAWGAPRRLRGRLRRMSTSGTNTSTGQPSAEWAEWVERAVGGAHRPPVQRTNSTPVAPDQSSRDLTLLRLSDLRALRREAQRDEADLSYVRRLLQGRIDILRAELAG